MVILDHVAFGARDRSEASDAMRALGFSSSPPCTCEWEARGSSHWAEATCCVFANQYLDLITISEPGWQTHLHSSSIYGRGLAPTGIVFSGVSPQVASRDVDAEPYSIVRRLDVDPPRSISYEFLPLARLGLPFGLISDSAPESLRQVSTLSHPNTASGIARLHLRVPSVRTALERIAVAPLRLPPSTEISIGTPRLHLYDRQLEGYLGSVSRLLPSTQRPTLLALEYSVASIQATFDCLRARGVVFRASGTSISIDPEQGFGTGIIFSQIAVQHELAVGRGNSRTL